MRIQAVSVVCLALALTGCSLTNTATPSAESPVTGAAIQGVVHGGQQPVGNAHVYLFAAGTSGYGGNGIAASASNASVSVFTAAETGQSDSVGPYILTTAGGNFQFPTYNCTPGTQLYVLALGGNPGAGTNSALGLMAALGACPSAGNLNTTVPYISINEITTIAAAYALAGFATDSTHIGSSGTALAQTGIANAFLNATNLVNLSSGAALATTPAGNGTVPQNEILTLANILGSCVNSNDANSTISSNCSTLFGYALSAGTLGTTPTDTASAAINIAHNPGTNIANLFKLPSATPPYAITGTYTQPNDFTIGLKFTGGGLSASGGIAIDGSGDVWATSYYGSVSKFASSGAAISPSGGYTGGGLDWPGSIAIDAYGNAWVANEWTTSRGYGSVSEFSSAGVALSPSSPSPGGYTGGGLQNSSSIAIDGSGHPWISNNDQSVSELNSFGGAVSPNSGYVGGGLNRPTSIAIDGSGNVWTGNQGGGNDVAKFSSSGTAISPAAGFTGGGVSSPFAIAIDSSANTWIANFANNSVSKFSNAGAALSPSTGFTGGGMAGYSMGPVSIAIDGSGDVWTANQSIAVTKLSSTGAALSPSTGYFYSEGSYTVAGGYIAIDGSGNAWIANINDYPNIMTELIGVATPVITPICAGLPATPTADGSSNLGTRP